MGDPLRASLLTRTGSNCFGVRSSASHLAVSWPRKMTCQRGGFATPMLALMAVIHDTSADAKAHESVMRAHRLMHSRNRTQPAARDEIIHPSANAHRIKVGANSYRHTNRAHSCRECARHESALRLDYFSSSNLISGTLVLMALLSLFAAHSGGWITRDLAVTLAYGGLYMLASPMAIILNKTLMKDIGFGYPVVVCGLGQLATMAGASLAVRRCHVPIKAGRALSMRTFMLMGCVSSTSLAFGQYPYLYLSVAFIQMLKAFSPAYLVLFLYLCGVETPSWRIVGIILAISACACVACAGEVRLHPIGLALMAAASTSDTIRLVLAQKLLAHNQLGPVEALWYTLPYTIAWLVGIALLTEVRAIYERGSIWLMWLHPGMFAGAALAGGVVNFSSFLLVKRTSSMTVKLLMMVRNAGLVLFSALVLGEETTPLELAGYGGLVVCFVAFTVERARPPRESDLAVGR